MAENIAAEQLIKRIKDILQYIAKPIDFTNAEASVHPRSASRYLVTRTHQDNTLPIHVFQWDELKDKYIKIKSYQFSKSVPPRSNKPGALRFILPTDKHRGVRYDLCNALDKLARDTPFCLKLKIKGIEITKETPNEMEWVVMLS
ncbi:hypothetical protein QQS21_012436 [Conoideocrella luteorostrata]|uniref:Uncharacterized protein n=1 Tax=Conoideocrella luteorostrata TaxID=1105319 RepID=A0AAJ0CB67_9HYPO|nr:hypothetical protein QQS21_012436 [Conoideocrella luteorostrata]